MNKDGRLSKWERAALEHFQVSAERLSGLPKAVLFNLASHKWIHRAEREDDYAPEMYVITAAAKDTLIADIAKDAASN